MSRRESERWRELFEKMAAHYSEYPYEFGSDPVEAELEERLERFASDKSDRKFNMASNKRLC